MNEKFQQDEEKVDETEGHMPRIRLAVPEDEAAEAEETQGHTGFVKRVVEDEDTEGHAKRI